MAAKVKLVTPAFRIAFCDSLFVPSAMEEGQKLKYSCVAIWTPAKFRPTDKVLWKGIFDELDAACVAGCKKKWADMPPNFKRGIRDGAEKPDTNGFGKGTMFATLSSILPPEVIDLEGNALTDKDIFAGYWCRGTVSPYWFEAKGNKGVALGLRSIQLIKDGPRIDGRSARAQYADHGIDAEFLESLEAQEGDDLA
jgi:hypothetical protein